MWYRDVFTVMVSVPGEPMKVAGVVTDITARKRAEQMIQQGHRLEAMPGQKLGRQAEYMQVSLQGKCPLPQAATHQRCAGKL